jgi:hypothetical protein
MLFKKIILGVPIYSTHFQGFTVENSDLEEITEFIHAPDPDNPQASRFIYLADSDSPVLLSENRLFCNESSPCNEKDLTKHENCKKAVVVYSLDSVESYHNQIINCCVFNPFAGGKEKTYEINLQGVSMFYI